MTTGYLHVKARLGRLVPAGIPGRFIGWRDAVEGETSEFTIAAGSGPRDTPTKITGFDRGLVRVKSGAVVLDHPSTRKAISDGDLDLIAEIKRPEDADLKTAAASAAAAAPTGEGA
jgi:hypothetical protein